MIGKNSSTVAGGLVWIVSGLALLIYGTLGLLEQNIPGIEELVTFINNATGPGLYLAAFLAIFIEGLYVIGSVFPGTTLVLILTILTQTSGLITFLSIILTIYIGWLLAGLCNVLAAKFFSKSLPKKDPSESSDEYAGITWFPAFRANMEVSQLTEGHSMTKVLFTSFKIKTLACLGLILYAFALPFFVDITNTTNEEGFWSLSIIAFINFAIGGYKIFVAKQQKTA